MSVNSKMTAIANAVRDLRGMSGTMGLDAMATNINGAKTAVDAALAALTEKGVTVPAGTKVDGLAALIAAIEAGGGLTMARGEYTPAENQNNAIIEHGLGKAPSLFILLTKSVYLTGKSYLWFACGFESGSDFNPGRQHTCVVAVSGHSNYSANINSTTDAMLPSSYGSYLTLPTTDTITYNSSDEALKAGTTYVWYAVA